MVQMKDAGGKLNNKNKKIIYEAINTAQNREHRKNKAINRQTQEITVTQSQREAQDTETREDRTIYTQSVIREVLREPAQVRTMEEELEQVVTRA